MKNDGSSFNLIHLWQGRLSAIQKALGPWYPGKVFENLQADNWNDKMACFLLAQISLGSFENQLQSLWIAKSRKIKKNSHSIGSLQFASASIAYMVGS